MYLDTQPAALEPERGSDPWAEFRVSGMREIVPLLRQLRDGSVPVNLNAPDGTSITLALWSFDTDSGRLAFSADERQPQLARLIEADEAMAVAYLESVKLQFDVQQMVLVRGFSTCALQTAMPREVYRFQRRAGYRLRTSERHSPTARVRHPAIPDMQLALRVLDVSIGGCALLLPADVPALEPGTQLHGVRVELDADTNFTAGLRLQHVSSLAGTGNARLGCEWVRIEGLAQRALQRYIDLMQRRRRLLAL
jgi:c-di-GMP-binding flagellar brake protein YcgR